MIEINLRKEKKYDIKTATSGESCLKFIRETIPDLVLLDIQMPGIDGIETLKQIKEEEPLIPVVMMSAHGTIERAVQSMKLGAYDFITKPFASDRLLVTVHNALMNSSLKREVDELKRELKDKYQFENIIGQSGVMQEVFRAMEKVVDSNVTVLIHGESGTGKELIARAIHFHNKKRSNKPFVAVNCSALPETLLESELFGHEKGSFTGATGRRMGKFEMADDGTIFLDEIALMTPATQAKVLRVLQEREFERVGGNEMVKVDTRVISATNQDLEEAVKRGDFREDLYYRISVFPIKLPALRERKEDIPLLAAHFLTKYAKQEEKELENISPDALELLMAYHWPGNVRELENAIERAVVLADPPEIISKDLPNSIRSLGEKKIYETDNKLSSWIEKLEEEALRQALLECEGNISQTAKKLGIGRATIYRKAKKYGLPMVK
ncbi:sigma-54-dependent Fis family transcriptional regulator [candidate division KSB1 bacterium]|nr:sigma-54-dependent Fis family transcriptional regulator [candidate division KSB1 bacterium]NIR72935.1 sigma-54-dependent Fis family transcriptional regulator [candidate division KSB1 bacterium]NIS28234.1 sigma-54-dependent Fis family transcriptional regulator [candidate division KSB1 bacterium]NIT75123.1 sigma-54-dependent Fis family transcriptional regulator [candidate division KSB1 bacterium]NIU28911.1 sigma-54-dependent Fis family transcriptional regulator [candidate division KSB1 bacteri